MKFQVYLLLRVFSDSGLKIVLLGKLPLSLTKTLNFSKFSSLKADKIEWRTYQMDYYAHESNLLHRSEIYEKSQKSIFVFSNRPQNFFIYSLSQNLILAK